jgi:murein DD-endopeptidase MepM/ murein hydrolase activator NlpD
MNLDPAPAAEVDDVDEVSLLRRVSTDASAGVHAAEATSDASASPAPLTGGSNHRIRERLLERAAQARRESPEQASSTDDEFTGSRDHELDRVASRMEPPASPALAGGRRELPPNVVALFGTLLGLAVLATLFAVLIHVDPRDGAARPAEHPTTQVAASKIEPVAPPPAPTVKKPERQRIPGPWRIADSTDGSLTKIEGTISHEPFLKTLEEAGVPHSQTFRVLAVMKGLRDLDHCGKGEKFAALVNRASSRLVAFEYIVSKEEVYQAREGSDGYLKASKLDLKVERARVQGAIRYDRATFAESVEAAGFERELLSVIDDALEGHASVADFKRGDRLRVVAQEVTVLGEFARYAGIEALEYVPAHSDDKPLRVYYFRGTKSHGYYDHEGRAVHEAGWRKPIKGAPITSRFNPKRMHPILHKIMPHQGTDFGAAMGTPVGAAGPGVVESVGYVGPTGNLVRIQHTGGIETGYAHLSRFEQGLKPGDHVTAMQIIGYVGSTGRSTGPHLHFSVKKNGVFVDPESLKLDALRVLPLEERTEFAETRAKYDALLDAIPLLPPLDEPAAAASAPAPPEEMDAPDEGVGDQQAAPPPSGSAEAPSAPAAPEASQAPAAPAASGEHRSSIYLSDHDLMKSQSATDEGEVAE